MVVGVAAVLGVGVLVSPPDQIDALGTLGRADASAPAVPAVPSLFGITGIDLPALGYTGADIEAVTLASLSAPFDELPMPRAADIRERLATGWPHLDGLHQAKNTLTAAVEQREAAFAQARTHVTAAEQVATEAEAHRDERQLAVDAMVRLQAEHPALPLPVEPLEAQLRDAEAAAVEARSVVRQRGDRLHVRWTSYDAHLQALQRTRHEVVQMDAHLRWLGHELARAQGAMPSAANLLAIEERGRRDIPIVRVGRFEVHESIATSLRQLLDHAAADGVDLRGDAYRSIDRQIELRRQNCGTSEYDVWQRPSGTCAPPTAIPGRSLHESGLAIDFRHGDDGISTRSSPAYQWLATHAPSYGFQNLPSEPWHWSATGS